MEFNAFLFAYIYIFEEVFVCRPYAHIYTRTKHSTSIISAEFSSVSIYLFVCCCMCARGIAIWQQQQQQRRSSHYLFKPYIYNDWPVCSVWTAPFDFVPGIFDFIQQLRYCWPALLAITQLLLLSIGYYRAAPVLWIYDRDYYIFRCNFRVSWR